MHHRRPQTRLQNQIKKPTWARRWRGAINKFGEPQVQRLGPGCFGPINDSFAPWPFKSADQHAMNQLSKHNYAWKTRWFAKFKLKGRIVQVYGQKQRRRERGKKGRSNGIRTEQMYYIWFLLCLLVLLQNPQSHEVYISMMPRSFLPKNFKLNNQQSSLHHL